MHVAVLAVLGTLAVGIAALGLIIVMVTKSDR